MLNGCVLSALSVAQAAHQFLGPILPYVEAADPFHTVSDRSRNLCAGLGVLAVNTYNSLGGQGDEQAVGELAAMLSLLTKIDDEVIDSLAFHGGHQRDRRLVRKRTQEYLWPTLESIKTARAVDGEPRNVFAALIGERLHQLACHEERRQWALLLFEEGWRTQVDSVATLTDHPSRVDFRTVSDVTARISGLWLMMICAIGCLPGCVGRGLTIREKENFLRWGKVIQTADSLADFAKDQREGLINTVAGNRLFSVSETTFEQVLGGNVDLGYRTLVVLSAHSWAECDSTFAVEDYDTDLRPVFARFEWIRQMLLGRYFDAVRRWDEKKTERNCLSETGAGGGDCDSQERELRLAAVDVRLGHVSAEAGAACSVLLNPRGVI